MFSQKKLVVLLSATLSGWPLAGLSDTENTITIPSLIVTADPLGNRDADDLITPVSVLADTKLDKQRNSTLGETVDGLPGVHNADFGPGVGRPVVRGLQGSRVLVLDDGMKTVDVAGEGGDHTVAIDPARADQIEVYRGPATLLYGSGAAGGVINVRSERFNPEFGDAPKVSGELGYGYNGDDRRGRLGLELPVTDNFVLRSDYSLRRSHDFDIDGYQERGHDDGDKDTLENSATDTDAFSLTGLFKGDWGFAGLGYSRWRTNYGVPGVLTGSGEEELENIRADYDRVDFRSEFIDPLPGFSSARLKLAYTEFNQEEIGTIFDEGVFESSESELAFENDEFDARFEMVHLPIGEWQGVVGVQFNDRDFSTEGEGHGIGGHDHDHEEDHHHEEDHDHEEEHDHEDEEHADEHDHGGDGFYVRANKTKSYGLFVLEERPTDFGKLEFAARIDHVDSSPVGLADERHLDLPSGEELHQEAVLGDRSFTPFSISGGAIIDLDYAHHLRFALSRSQRAPSPEQLYAFGYHAAAGTVEIGDPDLDEETYTNIELGLDRHAGPFRYNATVFYNRVKDFIYLAPQDDGTGNAVMLEGNTLVLNEQEDAEFYGAEFTAIADLIQGPVPFSLRFTGDHVRGKFRDGGNIPRMSPTRLGVGFDTGYGDWDLSVDLRHVFKQTKTAIAETDTGSYNLLSFDLFWRPASFKGGEFFVQGRNLLNENGRRHTSFLKDEAPIVGRTIFTGVRFEFGG
ncbi:TonB-dependent receptor [Methylophaga frappieri]|uniref:TonB-dependent receptor n=1 Tax=Methylophaga frappieri (strain ATCC BAA-2434 / DSM 25690 / JAM7) TaxID=754477 RepID=I1YG20_METFJ|nr:TonB-dependent receptor [Methylophaga frappieri]AFJ01863.1 TonB-dependent receptor [Methylophaga frappieri]